MNQPRRPKGHIGRVLQERQCWPGRKEWITPDSFDLRKGEESLSFYDCQQKSSEEALQGFSGKWTVALPSSKIKAVPGVADVVFDSPDDPAHVAVVFDRGEHMTKSKKKERRECLTKLAGEDGILSPDAEYDDPWNVFVMRQKEDAATAVAEAVREANRILGVPQTPE